MAFVQKHVKIDKEDYVEIKDDANEVILSSDLHQLTLYQGEQVDLLQGWENRTFNVPEIHRAAFYGDVSQLKLLLRHPSYVNLKITDGPKLLQYKADHETMSIGYFVGTTPLMVACSRGNRKSVKLLLRAGAKLGTTDSVGMTAFAWACTTNDSKLCDLLLSHNALIDKKEDRHGMSPLLIASKLNKTEIVETLVSRGANVLSKNLRGQTAMHFAAWNYNTKLIRLLRKKGLDVNVKDNNGCTPLHTLVSDDDLDEANVEVDGNFSKLEKVKMEKILERMQKHQDKGIGVIVDVGRTIHRGTKCYISCEEYFSLLSIVKLGADVNRRNSSGCTPLQVLASRLPKSVVSRGYVICDEPVLNQVCLVQMILLIKLGADINSRNILGKTALEMCAQSEKWAPVSILAKYTKPTVTMEQWDCIGEKIWKSGMKYCEKCTDLDAAVQNMTDTVLGLNRIPYDIPMIWSIVSRNVYHGFRSLLDCMWD